VIEEFYPRGEDFAGEDSLSTVGGMRGTLVSPSKVSFITAIFITSSFASKRWCKKLYVLTKKINEGEAL